MDKNSLLILSKLMRYFFSLLFFAFIYFLAQSCSSYKKSLFQKKKFKHEDKKNTIEFLEKSVKEPISSILAAQEKTIPIISLDEKIILEAKNFLGTPYKYGGSTRNGLDCSSLILFAFSPYNFKLPRTSINLSKEGIAIKKTEIKKSDLLFFATGKKRKMINHVALVVDVKEDEISFIHASSSKGVVISSLLNPYWRKRFILARRIIPSQMNLTQEQQHQEQWKKQQEEQEKQQRQKEQQEEIILSNSMNSIANFYDR